MDIYVEVRDLSKLEKPLLKTLKRHTFGRDGWMVPCIEQILEGKKRDGEPLAYNKASAVIARNKQGEILGWALVRHPSKRTAVKRHEFNWETCSYEWRGRFYSAGRRSDFMTFVREKYRNKGVARALLVVAYHNFGKVDAYPHDTASRRFYEKNSQFVVPHWSWDFATGQYESREVPV